VNFDQCLSCKENSKFKFIHQQDGYNLGMCEPDDGYYYVSEYSPEFRHGSAANFYVKKNLDVVIDPDYSGNEPILPTTQAFEKCDDTCFGCRGSSVKDCTACYPGKRLNVDRNYRRDRDPYPYGTCEL
jgi:ABC-type multidrug transport system fused ATPase/permease subunit